MGNFLSSPPNDKPFIKIHLNCTCIKGSENEIDYHDNVDGKEEEKEENSEINKKDGEKKK